MKPMSPIAASATIVNLLLATGPFTYPQGFVQLGPVTSSVLMMVIMYILISMLENRVLMSSGDDGDYFTTSQLSWFIWSALVKQGSILSPSGDVSRVLFGTWWIFITIVTAFYTAQVCY